MEQRCRVIAVDFDGTICENKWPEIGEDNWDVIEYLKEQQKNGAKLILWTCRTGELLEQAVCWCTSRGLLFDTINENLPETLEHFRVGSRKIWADEYIDDKNILVSSCHEKSNMELWAENEVTIACKREAPDRKDGEFDYGCACYESALKAFKSLLEDHHSGMSIEFTRQILNRLIQGKPCVPIEDTEDIWEKCDFEKGNKYENYQCKRMSSLFKKVYPDGTVKYNDVNRFVGRDVGGYYSGLIDRDVDRYGGYHSGLIDRVMSEMYPILIPYIPEDKPYNVYTEDLLTDRKNGDFDTKALLYVICPDGTRTDINRYFKESPEGWDEINEAEYLERKLMDEERLGGMRWQNLSLVRLL